MNSSKNKKSKIQLIINSERKSMFLQPNKNKIVHSMNNKNVLDTLFDDKKILYNSNIQINTKT
jgi:hypothetical protein